MESLEHELETLKKRLERADSRAVQFSLTKDEAQVQQHIREAELENELEECYKNVHRLKQDKSLLELSVQELQSQLTKLGSSRTQDLSSSQKGLNDIFSRNKTPVKGSMGIQASQSSIEDALKLGEREKKLELMLTKTKEEKDKAVRLIIEIIGKEKIASFLHRNAGSEDILDKMLQTFGGTNIIDDHANRQTGGTHQSSSPMRRDNRSPMRSNSPHRNKALYRNRIDEYHRSHY